MRRKRKVSGNLGRTQHREADEIYETIRSLRGDTKNARSMEKVNTMSSVMVLILMTNLIRIFQTRTFQ